MISDKSKVGGLKTYLHLLPLKTPMKLNTLRGKGYEPTRAK